MPSGAGRAGLVGYFKQRAVLPPAREVMFGFGRQGQALTVPGSLLFRFRAYCPRVRLNEWASLRRLPVW